MSKPNLFPKIPLPKPRPKKVKVDIGTILPYQIINRKGQIINVSFDFWKRYMIKLGASNSAANHLLWAKNIDFQVRRQEEKLLKKYR